MDKSNNNSNQPWTSGPAEILSHALSLLNNDNSVNRRLALIGIDNAVELMIKTYLSLPSRVTGFRLSRSVLSQVEESFPAMLDTLEEVATDKLAGIDLASIEWYHRIRNQLYHQGYGLSIERDKVEIYGTLANLLMRNLFGTDSIEYHKTSLLGEFMELWLTLEERLKNIAFDHSLTGDGAGTLLQSAKFLKNADIITKEDFEEIEDLRKIRNDVIHGTVDYKEVLNTSIVSRLKKFVESFDVESMNHDFD